MPAFSTSWRSQVRQHASSSARRRSETVLEGPAGLDRQRAEEADHGRSADADQSDEYELHWSTSVCDDPVWAVYFRREA